MFVGYWLMQKAQRPLKSWQFSPYTLFDRSEGGSDLEGLFLRQTGRYGFLQYFARFIVHVSWVFKGFSI